MHATLYCHVTFIVVVIDPVHKRMFACVLRVRHAFNITHEESSETVLKNNAPIESEKCSVVMGEKSASAPALPCRPIPERAK